MKTLSLQERRTNPDITNISIATNIMAYNIMSDVRQTKAEEVALSKLSNRPFRLKYISYASILSIVVSAFVAVNESNHKYYSIPLNPDNSEVAQILDLRLRA